MRIALRAQRQQRPRRLFSTSLALTLLLAAILLAVGTPPAQADNAVLRFEPDWSEIAVGEEREISLMLDNIEDLYGIELQMTFNATAVEVLDMIDDQAGVQVSPGDYPYPSILVKNEVRNSSGTIWYVAVMIAPREPLSGSGRVLTMRVKGRFAGDCPLIIHFVQPGHSRRRRIALRHL